MRPWQYDEFQQVGKDYTSPDEVAVYDETHAQFRDVQAEADRILALLGAEAGQLLLDFGCGTGAFPIEAARRGLNVKAIDVSPPMLDYARSRAEAAGSDIAARIEFIHAGFLTYEHHGPAVDFITTTFSFHHLPDFWKGIALPRLHDMLRPGGTLYLHDVVLQESGALEAIDELIAQQTERGGDFLKDDAEGHFREEFSTYDWVMDGLFQRAGFHINRKDLAQGVLATYLCKPVAE